MAKVFKVNIIDVDWDVDEEEEQGLFPYMLPRSGFQLYVEADQISDDGHEVADALSDEYGYCVNSACYEVLRVFSE